MNLHCSDILLLNSTIDFIKNGTSFKSIFFVKRGKNIIISIKTKICRGTHYT